MYTERGEKARRLSARGAGLVALAGLAVALHAPDFVITDGDGYYHLRHAWVYRERGLAYAEFPWMQRSVIGVLGADLWYGFHFLLVPLAAAADPVHGLRAGAVAVTFASLAVFYGALAALRAAHPLLWTVALPCVSADLALRLSMLRPHSLSLALAVALLAAVVPRTPRDAGAPRRRDLLLAGGIAFLLAWIHLALAWTAACVLAAVLGATWLVERRRPDLRAALAAFGGLLLGAVLRPAPLGGLRLAWIQLAGAPGPQQGSFEMMPLGLDLFLSQLLPLALLVVLALVAGGRSLRAGGPSATGQASAIARVASLGLAVAFLALAFVGARRASDLFAAFAVVFVALTASERLAAAARRPREEPRRLGRAAAGWALGVALFALATLRTWPLVALHRQLLAEPFAPERLRSASGWLAANAPGEVVFHVDWERFAHLFFWNPRSHYIHGLDPRFEHAYHPALSRAHQVLVADDVYAFANEETRQPRGLRHTLRRTLTEDFGASWVVLEKRRSPRFLEVLRDVFGIAPAFEDADAAVFAIARAPPEAVPALSAP